MKNLGVKRTYAHYQSCMKWFKQQYTNFCNLMRFSSGFGWDPATKKFTASDEVWDNYLKVTFFYS